ncbi:hypothetical protein GOODEAATRI_005017 [Goodea atripinnis]|uniref:Uncharacterized protein n=1 Tax=Goodea atripinnis TaxID=208336 RepID=A0ABV0PVD3_9TELE
MPPLLSLFKYINSCKTLHRKHPPQFVAFIRFKRTSNDITLLQCCAVHERCQSFPVITEEVSTGRSRHHHGVTAGIFLNIPGSYLCKWTFALSDSGSQFLFVCFPWDTEDFPDASRPEKSKEKRTEEVVYES